MLVEINCESDFVARTEDFRKLAQQIALQIAGANPQYVSQDEMPEGAEGDPKEVVLLLQPSSRTSPARSRTSLKRPSARPARTSASVVLPASNSGRSPVSDGPYKRILLKLSGEALQGDLPYGIDPAMLNTIASQIKEVHAAGFELAIVVGGGNIVSAGQRSRGGMDRATARLCRHAGHDHIRTLSTGRARTRLAHVRTQSAITVTAVAEPYIRRRAMRHLEKGRVVIFAAGTGNPYMTTDTAAALRAIEIDADVLLMAKKNVDGVYEADPFKDLSARKFRAALYLDALNRRLQVMDSTALSFCMENALPIVVFDLRLPQSIMRVATGEHAGTRVGDFETVLEEAPAATR